MKNKIIIFLLLIVCCLTGCSTSTNNEIYNKVYNVTIDITEFEDLVSAIGEKAEGPTIGINGTSKSLLSGSSSSYGTGVVYEGYGVLKSGNKIELKDAIDRNDVNYYCYYAITNYHVIEGCNNIVLQLSQKVDNINAKVEATDKNLDLAILSFSTTMYIKPLEFADSNNIKRGQFVIAMGYPEGFEYYDSLTFGVVSFVNRKVIEDNQTTLYIQTDVAINPGNSGGPLINMQGQVIGINTMKLVDEEIDGMGFAIPSNIVKQFINEHK